MTFVQIGIHTNQPLDEADLNLISKTTLPESVGLIRGAFSISTTKVILFTWPPQWAGKAASFWMNHCPRGFASARCMTEQPAAVVARAAEALFPIHRTAAPLCTSEQQDATQTVG